MLATLKTAYLAVIAVFSAIGLLVVVDQITGSHVLAWAAFAIQGVCAIIAINPYGKRKAA
jgi:hypothetical protein